MEEGAGWWRGVRESGAGVGNLFLAGALARCLCSLQMFLFVTKRKTDNEKVQKHITNNG